MKPLSKNFPASKGAPFHHPSSEPSDIETQRPAPVKVEKQHDNHPASSITASTQAQKDLKN